MFKLFLSTVSVTIFSLTTIASNLPELKSESRENRLKAMTIFFAGYVRGNYEPCGCQENPSGGLARRIGYIRDYQDQTNDRIISVELGSYLSPPGDDQKAVHRLMLDTLHQLPVHVFNLTAWDLRHWAEISKEIGKRTQFISTNIVWPEELKPRPQPFSVREVAINREKRVRIGFLGLTDTRTLRQNRKFRAVAPLKAIQNTLNKFGEEADHWIVLSDLTAVGAKEIALEYPQIVAVLLMSKSYKLFEPKQVNNAVILQSVERGRYLGQLRIRFDKDGKIVDYQPKLINLGPEIEDDRATAARIEALRNKLHGQNPGSD